MAVTRSRKEIKTGKKIKFSDDGDAPTAEILLVSDRDSTVEPESQKHAESTDGSEDEDSDEAPEEESVSSSKTAALSKIKQQEQLEQELRKQEREKRKQRDLHFKQQQDAKREKIKKLVQAEELPDLLPAEALESDDDEDTSSKTNGKHLRSEDFEKEAAAMRKRAKLEKLRNLKELRSQALKKGPVYVQVQRNLTANNRVPRAEAVVLDTKSSWFKRDSLNKK